jgi:hypothetical protein
MDKWKRSGNVLYNDDEIGYENAKKRIAKQKEKLDKEREERKQKEDFAEIKRKVDIMWHYLQMTDILPKDI